MAEYVVVLSKSIKDLLLAKRQNACKKHSTVRSTTIPDDCSGNSAGKEVNIGLSFTFTAPDVKLTSEI